MKKFCIHIFIFFAGLFGIGIVCSLMPGTPASESMMSAKQMKDSLLEHVPSPRIIFVGGSNLSFGLNSQIIKDSLALNPINTGLHARIGLLYMMDNSLPYIREGDLVIVAAEYQQFYKSFAYGGEALLRTIAHGSPREWSTLRIEQWISIFPYLGKYVFSKFNPQEYLEPTGDDVVLFNVYGDVVMEGKSGKKKIAPYTATSENLNTLVLDELTRYKEKLLQRGAHLCITFPGIQPVSFKNKREQIKQVEGELHRREFRVIGTPERYIMPDSMLFDTPYHLTQKGMDLRTKHFIEDFKTSLEVALIK